MALTPRNLKDFLILDKTSKTGLRWRKDPQGLDERGTQAHIREYGMREAGHESIGAGFVIKYYLNVNNTRWNTTAIIRHLEKEKKLWWIGDRKTRKTLRGPFDHEETARVLLEELTFNYGDLKIGVAWNYKTLELK